jgi:hypothetical protein
MIKFIGVGEKSKICIFLFHFILYYFFLLNQEGENERVREI